VYREGEASSSVYALDDFVFYYKRYEHIYIYKNDIPAAIMFRLEDKYVFYYLTSYIIDNGEPINPINITLDRQEFKDVPTAFEENIPEGINREILETQNRTADEFEMLLLLKDGIGDISFSKTLEYIDMEDRKKAPSFLAVKEDLLNHSDFENNKLNILEDYSIDPSIDLFPEGTDIEQLRKLQNKSDGISGFQYKKIVNMSVTDKKILDPMEEVGYYILKPYSKIKSNHNLEDYFPHMALNEHMHMNFAKNELGFDVPFSAIFRGAEDEEFHYIVKRFDRYGLYKFAKNTFAALMGLRSSTKYNTSSEKMFERINKELRSNEEKMKLLLHYAYSVIIVHEDMHTKNLSLIYDKGKILFAPLYDIATTLVYSTSKGYESHITINGKQTNIRINDFKGICKNIGILHKDFKIEAKRIAKIYVEKYEEYIDEVEKIERLPTYKKVLKKKIGDSPEWVSTGEPKHFASVLREAFAKRRKSLSELGWLD
jgi:serine/threonine-protein kinase HipA